MHVRERDDPYFRITYQNDGLCQMSLDNARRLLRAAKAIDESDNSALLAKKALQYRRLWSRVQSVDLEDPNFDLNVFLHITWYKAKPTETKYTLQLPDRANGDL